MHNIVELLNNFQISDGGATESMLQGVRFFKDTLPVPRKPMLYNPGICIVAQGHKIGYLGDHAFRYDADNYLVTSVAMPFECEASASPANPLLGLYIDIDMPQLHDLIGQMGLHEKIGRLGDNGFPLGIGPSVMDEDMMDATIKLLKALRSETEAKILAPGLVREIYYRALCGTQASVLYSLAVGSSSFSQVARVIRMMQGDYSKKLDVEQLASTANMSVSSFHKAFKEITCDSPIQYLKKIRLARARDLIMQKHIKAYIAADAVGYESSTQFSREFKRYFGKSPADIMREVR
ncbi:MAG: AraC family transcriptional [Desulfovibrionaceae bacterium]|nr:MAG: AraC family transcriptional [Desulfovibrionaceae bacterium]